MNLSVLNLVPLRQGQTYKEAIDDMVTLAKEAEKFGYKRYWIAEHHNMKNNLSSATDLLIEYVLDRTESIRVGSGGVMLPNHSPYIVAERYGMLEVMYPERVDLGLGRAPGTDRRTAQVIRRSSDLFSDFEEDFKELEGYFKDVWDVHAYPAAGLSVPFYILGSSTDSAYVAAEFGLPYAFAAHFAPAMLESAVQIYKENFRPSEYLDKPYVIVGCNVIAADTMEKAESLKTTMTQAFLNIITGAGDGLQPPKKNDQEVWDAFTGEFLQIPHFGPVQFKPEDLLKDLKTHVASMSGGSFVGDKAAIINEVTDLYKRIGFDELMVNSFVYNQNEQAESLRLFKEAVDSIDFASLK